MVAQSGEKPWTADYQIKQLIKTGWALYKDGVREELVPVVGLSMKINSVQIFQGSHVYDVSVSYLTPMFPADIVKWRLRGSQ